MALTVSFPFADSPPKWKDVLNLLRENKLTNRFAKMEQQISVNPTDQCEPPQEVVPNIPVEPNQIGIFCYTSERNVLNFWHTGKHSQFPSKLNWDVILSQPGEMVAAAILI